MIKNLLFSTIIILLFTTFSFGQEKQATQGKKFAFVNERVFFDKQKGIKDFTALNRFETGENQSELSENQNSNQINYDPATIKLFELLKQIEKQNNLIIFKIVEADENSQILALDDKLDVTKKIISFFNNKSNKTIEALKLDIPESKIVLINKNLFFDKQKGISSITKILDKYKNEQELCSQTQVCLDVGNALHKFAQKYGYGLIFDSSRKLPLEINKNQMPDTTQEFITEYNKSNK